ncbi:hypothetical protein ACUIJQ_08290 [Levilactobacillus hammesii]
MAENWNNSHCNYFSFIYSKCEESYSLVLKKMWNVFSRIWKNDIVRKWKINRRINKNKMTVGDAMYVLKHEDSFSKDQVDKVVKIQKNAMKLATIPNMAVTPASEVLEKVLTKLKNENDS